MGNPLRFCFPKPVFDMNLLWPMQQSTDSDRPGESCKSSCSSSRPAWGWESLSMFIWTLKSHHWKTIRTYICSCRFSPSEHQIRSPINFCHGDKYLWTFAHKHWVNGALPTPTQNHMTRLVLFASLFFLRLGLKLCAGVSLRLPSLTLTLLCWLLLLLVLVLVTVALHTGSRRWPDVPYR